MDYTHSFVSIGFVLFCVNIFFAAAVPECVPPFIPMNGSIDIVKPKYEARDTITYSCSSGFLLVGDRTRTCQTDTSWTGQMPFCDRHTLDLHDPNTLIRPKTSKSDPLTIIDRNRTSCFLMDISQGLRVSLVVKAVVNAVRVFLPKGNYNFGVSVEYGNGKRSSNDYHGTLVKEDWVSVLFKENMTAHAVCIQDKSYQKTYWKICEVEVYGNDDSSCKYPPDQVYVPNGQLIISREKAIMKCDGPRRKTGLYFVCEKSQWKGVGKISCGEHKDTETNRKSDNAKIVIIASVVVVCLVICCFIVALIFIYRKRQNSVIVVLKPKEHYCRTGCKTSTAEAEYETIIYDDIPLTPVPRKKLPKNIPPNLPDLLMEYREPADEAKGNSDGKQNQNSMQNPVYVVPQDALSKDKPHELGILKKSSFYGE